MGWRPWHLVLGRPGERHRLRRHDPPRHAASRIIASQYPVAGSGVPRVSELLTETEALCAVESQFLTNFTSAFGWPSMKALSTSESWVRALVRSPCLSETWLPFLSSFLTT